MSRSCKVMTVLSIVFGSAFVVFLCLFLSFWATSNNYKKQLENALETLEIFVPLAYNIGAYHIKHELEDLSLRYLDSDIYDDGYINYEPFLIGNYSFGLTVVDETINEEILYYLINQENL